MHETNINESYGKIYKIKKKKTSPQSYWIERYRNLLLKIYKLFQIHRVTLKMMFLFNSLFMQ